MIQKNKKGELTSKQLITIIILIVSFSIILIFIFSLGLKSTIDKESCRQSVIMKGALPMGKDIVQLKCKTTDICLSMSDDCEIKIKDLKTVDVGSKDELIQEKAMLLYDCWWMMGEGKVDYMSSSLGFDEAYCSICSKVYFDKKIQEEYPGGIPYTEIYSFMRTNKIPEKDETYLFYFYKLNSLDSLRNSILESQNRDIFEAKIDPKKPYVSITAIIKQNLESTFLKGSLVAGGLVVGTILGGQTAIGGALGAFASSKVDTDTFYRIPEFIEFKKENLEKFIKCEEYVSEI